MEQLFLVPLTLRFQGNYSQVAADVIAQKYFRKAGIPIHLKKVKEENIPSWLWRSEPDLEKLNNISENIGL